MKKEISVLRYLNSDGYTTQRDIAKLTGMSLGNVNAAIKSLILKGLLQKKASNERDVRYILTAEGKRKKSIAIFDAYSEIVGSMLTFQRLIEEIVDEYCVSRGLKPILLGEEDEIFKYLVETFKKMNVKYEISKIDDLLKNINERDNRLVIVWHPKIEIILKKDDIRYVYILDEIDKRTDRDRLKI